MSEKSLSGILTDKSIRDEKTIIFRHVFEAAVIEASPIPHEMYEFAAQHDKFICTDVPVKNGRIELIHYIKEQSVSFEYHRYGSFSEVPPVE